MTSSNGMRAFLISAMSNEGTATALMQRRAYDWAAARSDVEVLARMARLPYLDPEIDALIGARTEADVISAWMGKPGRTKEEIVLRLRGERRATLLLDLAREGGLPDETYAHLHSTGSVTVDWALLSNARAPRSIRVSCAQRLGAGFTTSNRGADDKLRPISRLDTELWSSFVSSVTRSYTLERIAYGQIGVDDFDRVKVLVSAAVRLATNPEADWRERERALASIRLVLEAKDEQALSHEQVMQVAALAEPAIQATGQRANGLRDAISRMSRRHAFDMKAAQGYVSGSNDPIELANRADSLRRELQDMGMNYAQVRQIVGEAVLDSPVVTADMVMRERNYMDQPRCRSVFALALARKDRDLALQALSVASSQHLDLFTEQYRAAEQPAVLLDWLLGDGESTPSSITRSKVVREDPELAIAALPLSTTLADAAYSARISAELEAQFGDQSAKWEAFFSLSPEWTGSFTQLVKAVNSVS